MAGVGRAYAELTYRDPAIRPVSDAELERAAAALRKHTKLALPGLLRDLKEAQEAFLGADGPVRLTLAVGCAEIAKNAIVELRGR